MKRTPELSFRPDPAVREATRIEAILADIGPLPEHDVDDDDTGGAGADATDG